MADEEKSMRGPLGLWHFPILNRGLASEAEKAGTEGVVSRTLEKAPGFIINQAGKTAGAVAGGLAKDVVTERLGGFLRPGILLKI